MTGDLITHLGVGGIFAVLIIREVLPLLLRSSNGNGSSRSVITRSECDMKMSDVQRTANCEQIVRRLDDRFNGLEKFHDERQKVAGERFDSIDSHLCDVKKEMRTLVTAIKKE